MIDYHEVTGAPRIVLGADDQLIGVISAPGVVRLYFDAGPVTDADRNPPEIVHISTATSPETAAATIEFLDPAAVIALCSMLYLMVPRAFPGYEPKPFPAPAGPKPKRKPKPKDTDPEGGK